MARSQFWLKYDIISFKLLLNKFNHFRQTFLNINIDIYRTDPVKASETRANGVAQDILISFARMEWSVRNTDNPITFELNIILANFFV